MTELNIREIENLDNGAIEQATDDYLRAKWNLYKLQTFIYKTRNGRCLGEDRMNRMIKQANVIYDCLKFFRSPWFEELTHMDPEYFINELNKEFRSKIPMVILNAL